MEKKRNKGITLVALVITIIILLILAGVSLSILTQSGLISNANLAKKQTQEAQERENKTLDDYEKIITSAVSGSRDLTNEELQKAKEINSLSLEEKVIGKFIDNKTLYQKTIRTTYTTDDTQTFNHNIKNVDKIYIDASNTFLERWSATEQTTGYTKTTD